jgi:ADP-ribose pyrophosphatase YjhB (NUDIX family)
VSGNHYPERPRVGVGAVVFRAGADGRPEVLLVRRGRPPGEGQWSLPGGSQELGETLFACAEREAREETGVAVRAAGVLTAVDTIERDADGRVAFHYTIVDVLADWISGEPQAADDALDARFAPVDEALRLVQWDVTRRVIADAAAAWPAGQRLDRDGSTRSALDQDVR